MFKVETERMQAGNLIVKVDGKEFLNIFPSRKEHHQYLDNEDEIMKSMANVSIEVNVKNFDEEEDVGIIRVVYHPNEFIKKLMLKSDFDVYVKEYSDFAFYDEDCKKHLIPVYEVYIRNFSDPEIPIVAHIATLNFFDIDDPNIDKQFGCLFKDKITGGFYTVTSRTKDGVLDAPDDPMEAYNLSITFE